MDFEESKIEKEVANKVHLLITDINTSLMDICIKHSSDIVDVYNKIGGVVPISIENLDPVKDPVKYLVNVIPTLIELDNALRCFAKQVGLKIPEQTENMQNKVRIKIQTKENPEVKLENSPVKKSLKHWASGAVKAAKALTLPETEDSKARLAVCHGCDKWTGTSCKVCGCYVNLKVKIPEEKCPEGKW